jgi:diguanylate cyclase (GGDEF)-like protein
MIARLVQIRSRGDALLAACAITAVAMILAMTMTALATMDTPAERQWRAVQIAAWVSFSVGSIFSYWFVDSFRAMVQLKDTVDRLARTDELTGLNNRRAFLEDAEREIAAAERQDCALALLILDLDYFKRVNDTFGHRIGDVVLVAVAQALVQSVRDGVDLVGRLGGEEFAVLLTRCDEEAALRAAESIRAAIEAERISTPVGPIGLTVSVGCAPLAAGENISGALQKADEALYAAKRAGRNRVAACMSGNVRPDPCERANPQRREPAPRAPLKRSA